jgi:hypothetical protein
MPARNPKKTNPKKKGGSAPKLLSGGNPQIAKADGDEPVQAYITAMPDWKAEVGRRLDELITTTVPEANKAVRWNSPVYGIAGQGWFAGFHTFTNYVKLTFFMGTSLDPEPEGGTSKDGRWIDVREGDLDDPDFLAQLVSWFEQAAAVPGWGKN